ncbi:MAG: phosphatase PAP2/dual specificity phosphatase family protein [Holophagales bacterium]|nr:phosphatase PAP2/dual specificity phosphatase family protein [Holophagales bacterium]
MTGQGLRPRGEAVLWLAFLGVFFFGTYGWATAFTATRADVGVVVWAWERHIPFLPWTIVPYWSIDLAYAASVLLCTSRRELRVHVARLVLASLVSLAGFLAFPLRFSFERPAADGLPGLLFTLLSSFDLPYNQAPSLHISLLLVLWTFYAGKIRGPWRWGIHGWALLVGLSVLTTWQHHAVDVVTGVAAGVLCLCAVPVRFRIRKPDRHEAVLGLVYLLGGLAAFAFAAWRGGWGWLLAWPGLALALVAAGYLGLVPGVFGPPEAPWYWHALMLPVRLGATLSARLQARGLPGFAELAPGLWVGRAPRAREAAEMGIRTVVNLAPEILAPGVNEEVLLVRAPLLDLATPSPGEWEEAVSSASAAWSAGPVLIHCALGLQRSVLVACAVLTRSGVAPAAAWERAREARPRARARPSQLALLGIGETS